MSKNIPKPRCTECDGFGEVRGYTPKLSCLVCGGTGTLNDAYNRRIKETSHTPPELENSNG